MIGWFIGLMFLLLAIIVIVNIVLIFGPPLLIISLTTGWATNQKWTKYPNLNGLFMIVVTVGVWLLLCIAVGQGDSTYYGQFVLGIELVPFASSPNDPWHGVVIGALKVGIGTIALALIAIITLVLFSIFTWLFTPRKRS